MNKRPIFGMILISGFLLLLAIPSSLAIYRNSGQASGLLSSAIWNVSLNQNNVEDHLSIVPNGATADYTLNIRSTSEVDVVYSVIIRNLPNHVTVLFDGANAQTTTQDNDTIIFNEIGTILYSSSTKEKSHILTFRAETGAAVTTNRALDVDVVVRQVL